MNLNDLFMEAYKSRWRCIVASRIPLFQIGVAKAFFLRWCHCLVHFHSMSTYSEGIKIGPFFHPLKYVHIGCTTCGKLFYGAPLDIAKELEKHYEKKAQQVLK